MQLSFFPHGERRAFKKNTLKDSGEKNARKWIGRGEKVDRRLDVNRGEQGIATIFFHCAREPRGTLQKKTIKKMFRVSSEQKNPGRIFSLSGKGEEVLRA